MSTLVPPPAYRRRNDPNSEQTFCRLSTINRLACPSNSRRPRSADTQRSSTPTADSCPVAQRAFRITEQQSPPTRNFFHNNDKLNRKYVEEVKADLENANYCDPTGNNNVRFATSLGFGVTPKDWAKLDKDLIELLSVAHNNDTVIAYPAQVKPDPKGGAVKFHKSEGEHIHLEGDQKKKIHRRQTGKHDLHNLEKIPEEGETNKRTSGGSQKSKTSDTSRSPSPAPRSQSPRTSGGSGHSAKSSGKGSGRQKKDTSPSGTKPSTPRGSGEESRRGSAFSQTGKKNSADHHDHFTNTPPSSAPPPPETAEQATPEEGCEEECCEEGQEASAPCENQDCNCQPNVCEAKLIQCFATDYSNCNCCQCSNRSSSNFGRTLIGKRQNRCRCGCRPIVHPCPCRQCRVYHYCLNILNRAQRKPEDVYTDILEYESTLRRRDQAMENCNKGHHGGAKNWFSPPEGYEPATESGGLNNMEPNREQCDPPQWFFNQWQTEYSSQFTDFTEHIRKGVRLPNYNPMNGGRYDYGGGGNRAAASRCCGGGQRQRRNCSFDSHTRDSGCGAYVQIPEEVRRIGELAKRHSCATDALCNVARPLVVRDWIKEQLARMRNCCVKTKEAGCCPLHFGEPYLPESMTVRRNPNHFNHRGGYKNEKDANLDENDNEPIVILPKLKPLERVPSQNLEMPMFGDKSKSKDDKKGSKKAAKNPRPKTADKKKVAK